MMHGTYSAHYQLTASRIQLLYLHSECYCSGWSGDIHCNIHTRMFQGNCGTSVSILRSLLNTRWYLKTQSLTKKFNLVSLVPARVLICIQKNDWCSYTENDKITSNRQKYSFLIGWLVLLVYADQSVMVIIFWPCRKSLLWVPCTQYFYMLPRDYQGKRLNSPYRTSNQGYHV